MQITKENVVKIEKIDILHAYKYHVNLTQKELVQRIRTGYVDGKGAMAAPSLATAFSSENIAFKAIERVILSKQDLIRFWLEDRYREEIEIEVFFTKSIGFGVAKATNFNNLYSMHGCRVVLRLGYNGNHFEVVTAYPIPNAAIKSQIQKDRNEFLKTRYKK